MRKPLNIFGTSFLDLLSGALAAVIILFVIVPKMTAEQQNVLEQIEQMEVQMSQLTDIMQRLQNTIDRTLYEQIQQQIEQLQNTIAELRHQTQVLQQRLAAAESENRQLRQQNGQLQQQLRERERQLSELQQRLNNCEGTSGVTAGKIFGTNAELGIICSWPENIDVDLYVRNSDTGEECYYRNKDTRFGNLLEDVQSHANGDDRYELFYQKKIKPGRYLVRVNIYEKVRNWNGQPAHVSGYMVMHPGQYNQIKIPYRNITLTQKGVFKTIGTLIVTETNITLQQ